MAFETLHESLRNLQQSSDAVKRKWLIILSGIAMALIIILWVVYLSLLISSGISREESTTVPSAEFATQSTQGESIFSTLKRGAAEITASIAEAMRTAKNQIIPRWNSILESVTESREIAVPG